MDKGLRYMIGSTTKKNKTDFIVQGSILAIAGIVVRLIGLVYRIPLQNKLGDDAMGIYSAAYNIYNIILLLSSYSIPLAVSKMVVARVSVKQYRNSFRIFKSAMIFSVAVGLIATAISYFGAGFFAEMVLKMPDAKIAIQTLSPAIFIMAVLGVLRGYFQGQGTMIPTAISQLLEQIVNAGISLLAAFYLFSLGTSEDTLMGTTNKAGAYGAAGATLGTVAGALTAMLFCGFLFFVYYRALEGKLVRDKKNAIEPYSQLIRVLVATIVPVILSTAIYNISSLVDNSVFGYYVEFNGISAEEYKTVWGVYSGKYTLLTNVPVAIANALASSVIPALVASVTRRDRGDTLLRVNITIRFTMIIAIPCTVGLMVLAGPIIRLLYPGDNGLASELLILGGVAVAFFSLSTVTNAILQGINKMRVPVRNALIALLIHVGVLFLLLYGLNMGIYGVVIANMLFGLTMCMLNSACISDYLQYRQEIKKTFVLPSVASAIMGVAAWGVYQLGYRLFSSNAFATILAIVIAVAVYGVLLLLLKCVDEVELYDFPMGGRLAKLAKKMHLLK